MTALAFDRLRIDDDISGWVVGERSQPWIAIAHTITVLGNTLTLTAICVVAVVGLLIGKHVREAVLLGVGSLAGATVMVALKHLFARSRPPVPDRLLHIESYSFPSGHAMMSMVVYCLLAVVAYRLVGWVRTHRWVLIAAPALATAIGLTRVYLGVHWPSDVVVGWLLGVLWVMLCTWVASRVTLTRENRMADRRNPPVG